MAVYFLNVKSIGRSGGSSAVRAAAYRSGERIHDERTGRTYDYAYRDDILHKEIVVPSEHRESSLDWAQDRAHLWNSAEHAESRKNARVAREYVVALPVELDAGRRIALARNFSQELSDRYRFAVDLAVHAPRDYPDSDPRNFHAHLLATTREVGVQGFTRKTTAELSDAARRDLGLQSGVHEFFHVRERWASVANESLREAGIDMRIDHRTLAAQGIDREPYPYIPRAAFEMERHGYRSAQAEQLRRDYQERLEARREQERKHVQERVRESSVQAQPMSLADIRRQAREDWLKLRAEMGAQNGRERDVGEISHSAGERVHDDDLSL